MGHENIEKAGYHMAEQPVVLAMHHARNKSLIASGCLDLQEGCVRSYLQNDK